MQPDLFSGEHRSIVGQPPAWYWGTFWESDDGAMTVVAEIKFGDGRRTYISDCVSRAKLGSLSHDEAAHLWLRRRIDADDMPPARHVDEVFVTRMLGKKLMF